MANSVDLDEVAHYEPPLQDLLCLQIQLFSSLVLKEFKCQGTGNIELISSSLCQRVPKLDRHNRRLFILKQKEMRLFSFAALFVLGKLFFFMLIGDNSYQLTFRFPDK